MQLRSLFGLGLLVIAIPAFGQDPRTQTVAGQDPIFSTNLPLQKVGPGDLLSLQIYDSPELSRTIRVSPQGNIRLPMLKDQIKVDGLMPPDIEILIAEALQRDQILVDPFVTVNVAEYHSRPVSVMGSVRAPTIFQALGEVTLLDALARAGGLVQDGNGAAGTEIIVTRPNGDGPPSKQIIPVRSLVDGSDPSLNIKLYGGEEIRVPQAGQIVVTGNVTQPGSYPILDPSTTTVNSMIAQAKGLAQYYGHVAYIYRADDQGNRHEIPVDLWGIQKRKSPDIVLQAKDILFVPDSSGRRITQEMVNALTNFGTTASAGVLVYRAH
jgi:polysaccharide export outer membrane protein